MGVTRRTRALWLILPLLAAFGCGGEGPGIVEDDPAVAPFVGTWDATAFVVTNAADSTDTADLLIDGDFNIVVQPSGLYTATLVFAVLGPLVEIGQLEVDGQFITLNASGGNPCPATSEYSFSAPDYLIMDGPTCFDFNLDGTTEDAFGHIELQRR